MSEQTLRTLLRDHVDLTEPAFTLRPADSMSNGVRRRQRARFALGFAGLVTAGGVVAVAIGLSSGGSGPDVARDDIDPLTQSALGRYDPLTMPDLIDDHIRSAIESYLPLGTVDVNATDEQRVELPRGQWDQASWMTAQYGGTGDHRVQLSLGHERANAEGDHEQICRDATKGPEAYLVSCEATTLPDGSVAVVKVSAAYEDFAKDAEWVNLNREHLLTATKPEWAQNAPGEKLDPSEIFFMRSVEVVHSETFVTEMTETVRAASYDVALGKFAVPESALTQLATDPELVIPVPDEGTKD